MPAFPSWLGWCVFATVILVTMGADRWLTRNTRDQIPFRDALVRSLLWLTVGVGFTGWMYAYRGVSPAIEYLTAYLVEKSLSVDNLFVFLVIFRYFKVLPGQQQRVLFWGVFGAVVLRALFIVAGTELLKHFHYAAFVFGAFLVYSGIKLAFTSADSVDPGASAVLRFARRVLRTTKDFDGEHFFVTREGVRFATPLLLVLLVVEMSDVMFAVDSVPAVLAISDDLYVVYTSNVLAVLGLRALFFMLSGVMERFHKLDLALSAVLAFIGAKMLLHDWYQIPDVASLGVITLLLGAGVVASLLLPPPPPADAPEASAPVPPDAPSSDGSTDR